MADDNKEPPPPPAAPANPLPDPWSDIADAAKNENQPFSEGQWRVLFKKATPKAVTSEVVPPAVKEEEADQRWWLRYTVAAVVVLMLWMELAGIFLLLLFQGLKIHLHIPWMQWTDVRFQLNDWLFGL